jgi:hypothetical protein
MIARKKPVEVEVWQFHSLGDLDDMPEWALDAMEAQNHTRGSLYIQTSDGTMEAMPGDYLIKDVTDEVYPITPDIFEETYEIIG